MAMTDLLAARAVSALLFATAIDLDEVALRFQHQRERRVAEDSSRHFHVAAHRA